MKKYVFFTFSIYNVGGSQIYIRNKTNYLIQNGWQVFVFSFQTGESVIQELMKYSDFCFKELSYPPYLQSEKKVEKICNKIADIVSCNEADEVIVESNDLYLGVWGEKVASILHARHLLYSLQEKNIILFDSFYHFLKFKLDRKELVGIDDKSLRFLFFSYLPLNNIPIYTLPALSTNVIENVSCNFPIGNVEADHTILVMSRIDKTFIYPLMIELFKYVNEHLDFVYNIWLLGGGSQNQLAKIDEIFRTCKNVNFYCSGFIYPIPFSLLQKADVAIASSGCVKIISRAGIPTISIDANDLMPIGIFGHTTINALYRNGEEIVPLQVLLDDIVIKKKYKKKEVECENPIVDYSSHLAFVSSIDKPFAYYDFSKLKLPLIEKMKSLIIRFLGVKVYEFVKSLFFIFY